MKVVRTITGTEPVTLEQLKRHLGFPTAATERDSDLQGCLTAAREMVESYCGRYFVKSTVSVTFAAIAKVAYLPYYPIISITTVPESMLLDVVTGRIEGEYESGETVVYVAGYENGVQPYAAKQAILQCAAELYENPSGLAVGTPIWKHTAKSVRSISFIQ